MAAAIATAGALLWGWLWDERFWLPANVTWADLEGGDYPRTAHLLGSLPLAVGIFALRRVFERFIAVPCANHFGIQEKLHKIQPNAILEKVYMSITKCPDARRLEGLSKQLDWDVRKIQRWFRHRRNQDKPSILTKFCESMWRFTFYILLFSYGIKFLWVSPWFWDVLHCWYNYPFQPLVSSIYYYYVIQLAFYLSLTFSQFTDVKRKDFLMMFVHHLVAIGLLIFSYSTNMVRMGSLIICLHDSADSWLEAAKLANYAKYQRFCDSTFILFSAIFIFTRLGIYPFWLLYSTIFESWKVIGPYQSWWLFLGLLLIVQLLDIIWAYFVLRVAYKALGRGKVAKDSRSDVESSSDEEDATSNGRKGIHSTSTNGSNRINGHISSGQ